MWEMRWPKRLVIGVEYLLSHSLLKTRLGCYKKKTPSKNK